MFSLHGEKRSFIGQEEGTSVPKPNSLNQCLLWSLPSLNKALIGVISAAANLLAGETAGLNSLVIQMGFPKGHSAEEIVTSKEEKIVY